MAEGQRKQSASKGAIAACIAAACALATPLIMASEGLRTKPYLDPVKIPTVCYGETNVPMRVYSSDECGAMLRDRLARLYAPKVLACLPQLAAPGRRHEFAALIDSSYNAGPAAVCSSRMARHIHAGNWTAACNSLEGWYTTARDRRTGIRKTYPGLVRRRLEAKQLCLAPERAPAAGRLQSPPTSAVTKHSGTYRGKLAEIAPPTRFQGGSESHVVYGTPTEVKIMCNNSAALACVRVNWSGQATKILPNPCAHADREYYAAIDCHENGHVNGWPGEHGA